MVKPLSSTVDGLEELSRQECFALLGTCPVGRVAISRTHAAPLVVPVNFVLDGEVIVFRTAAGTKVDRLRTGPIGFEVDAVDPFHHAGWSVYVEGPAYEATHWEVEHLELEPWAPGDKDRWIRLSPAHVSGRRIRSHALVFDARGYL
jgi:nitroimidazol reductase NimA-like FMN-containing flavoprotein (pyridoxamine 5'-phosphate oxidase superfamily)